MIDFTVVGGGIVGAATAYKLSLRYPNATIYLLEKESRLAAHQTGNNSGVIHSGLYYKPNSYKAKNCMDGRKQLVAFSEKYKVQYDVCGKVVVATDHSELPLLDHIFSNGIANRTEGIEKINSSQVSEIEPFVKSIGGIWVPCTGIINFIQATKTMSDLFLSKNEKNKLLYNEKVTHIFQKEDFVELITEKRNAIITKHVIFCAGLYSDTLALKDNVKLKERIVPFRGDYYELTPEARHKVKNLIYPVPNPKFPFLGVHFTRMTNGSVECGPNAVFSFKKEGYSKTSFSLNDTINALSYKGTWKLLLNHTQFAINEYRRAFSKQLFLNTLQKLIPDLKTSDITPGRSGVRAMLLNHEGSTKDDFRIEKNGKCLHVINAPSPAATACLAIADEVISKL